MEAENFPTYCEGCGGKIGGPDHFIDADKYVVWNGYCDNCKNERLKMTHSHISIVCVDCSTPIGGCRCMDGVKVIRREGRCAECTEKAAKQNNFEKENKSEIKA